MNYLAIAKNDLEQQSYNQCKPVKLNGTVGWVYQCWG